MLTDPRFQSAEHRDNRRVHDPPGGDGDELAERFDEQACCVELIADQSYVTANGVALPGAVVNSRSYVRGIPSPSHRSREAHRV